MAKATQEPATALELFQAGQVDEWGVYVAVVPIDIDGARAFNPGDAVPASHVTRGVVPLDQVRDRTDAPDEPQPPSGPVVYRRGMAAPEPEPPPEPPAAKATKPTGGE